MRCEIVMYAREMGATHGFQRPVELDVFVEDL